MASGKELCREEPSKGPVQQRAAYVRQGWGGQGCSRDSPILIPIPIPGRAPWCHGTDCATCSGAAALQDGETVAPQDGAGGGGTVAAAKEHTEVGTLLCTCPTEHIPTAHSTACFQYSCC